MYGLFATSALLSATLSGPKRCEIANLNTFATYRVLLQLAKAIAVASTTRGVALYEQYDLSASQEWVF